MVKLDVNNCYLFSVTPPPPTIARILLLIYAPWTVARNTGLFFVRRQGVKNIYAVEIHFIIRGIVQLPASRPCTARTKGGLGRLNELQSSLPMAKSGRF